MIDPCDPLASFFVNVHIGIPHGIWYLSCNNKEKK